MILLLVSLSRNFSDIYVGSRPDIAKTFGEAPLLLDSSRAPVKFADTKEAERAEHGNERRRVDQNARRFSLDHGRWF